MKVFITKNKSLQTTLSILFWILVWQGVALLVSNELLIASPISVLKVLYKLIFTSQFWISVFTSLIRVILGFLLGTVIGAVMAVVCFKSALIKTLLLPLITIVKTVPVASFIIIALVWIKTATVSVFIAALTVLPFSYFNIYEGLCAVDVKLLEMAKVFSLSKHKTLTKIYIPSILPFFIAALKSGLGFAWKSGIAAEVIALPSHTIGREIKNAKIYLETPELFAWTLVVILLSFILEKGVVYLIEKTVPLTHHKGGDVS